MADLSPGLTYCSNVGRLTKKGLGEMPNLANGCKRWLERLDTSEMPASATKLSCRAAPLAACLLHPHVKLQRAIGAACAAGSAPEPLPCTLLAAIGEARHLGERVVAHSV
jgi:hypothetical protein